MEKMMKKLTKKNASEIRRELGRAHIVIALLSLAMISLLSLGATQVIKLDATLSGICVALLTVVILLSIITAITLFKNKK